MKKNLRFFTYRVRQLCFLRWPCTCTRVRPALKSEELWCKSCPWLLLSLYTPKKKGLVVLNKTCFTIFQIVYCSKISRNLFHNVYYGNWPRRNNVAIKPILQETPMVLLILICHLNYFQNFQSKYGCIQIGLYTHSFRACKNVGQSENSKVALIGSLNACPQTAHWHCSKFS